MSQGRCRVVGCGTGSTADNQDRQRRGQKTLGIFQPPKDSKLFSKWLSLIPNVGIKNFAICELHFKDDEVLKDYRTRMPDGTLNIIERGTKKLLKGAIPSINLPDISRCKRQISVKQKLYNMKWDHELSKIVFRPDSPIDESCSKTVARGMCDYDIQSEMDQLLLLQSEECSVTVARGMCDYNLEVDEEIETFEVESPAGNSLLPGRVGTLDSFQSDDCIATLPDAGQSSALPSDFNFNTLLQNLNQVRKPHKMWTITSMSEYIICSKWDHKFMSERRIIIDTNLNVRVYLKHKEIMNTSDVNLKLSSFEDLSRLIETVHDYLICDGMDDPEMELNCLLFVERTHRMNYKSILCLYCKDYKKENYVRPGRSNWRTVLRERAANLQRRAVDAERKNGILERKVTLMDEHIKELQEKLKEAQ